MGRLTRIEKIVNDNTPDWTQLKIVPRGTPIFVDKLLSGVTRFGRKTGATLAVLNADNTVNLAEDTQLLATSVFVDRLLSWFEVGALISVGPGIETAIISDIIEENKELVLADPLRGTHSAATEDILLLATPMKVAVAVTSGSSVITVASRYNLVNGDVITFARTPALIDSLVEFEALQVTYIGLGTDPEYTLLYRLDLDTTLVRDLIQNETIYLRAYPAYVSKTITIQTNEISADPLSPFLFDYVSGRLTNGKQFKEVFSVQVFDRGGGNLVGSLNAPLTIEKNFFMAKRPIPANFLLFWDIIQGKLNYKRGRTICEVDEDGKFAISQRLIPPLPADHTWFTSVWSEDDITLRIKFEPNDWVEYNISANTSTQISVGVPAGQEDSYRAEIAFMTPTSGSTVQFSDWITKIPQAASFQYNILGQVVGQAHWQSTGIELKPYFMLIDYVLGQYDTGKIYDGGVIYL